MIETPVTRRFIDVAVVIFLSLGVLLMASGFLWTGALNTSGLNISLNDQAGYIVTARNIAEQGKFESNVYYPAKVLYYKSHNVPYMPGNYYVRALFFYLFGYSLFIAFLPNLISFVGSSVLLFLIASKIFDRRVAYLATILFMLFPPLVIYAFSAMMENLFVLACLMAFYIYISLPEKFRYLFGVLTLLPAILIRETAVFMVFGYAAMILLSNVPRAAWKSSASVVVSLAVVYIMYQLPPMSDRPPTFYARLINSPSLHYTDAYGLHGLSFSMGDTVRLVGMHFLQNLIYLLKKLFTDPLDMGFVFFLLIMLLLGLNMFMAVRGLNRHRQFSSFILVTAVAELIAILLLYDFENYTGARLALFWLPFLLCAPLDAVMSRRPSLGGLGRRILFGVPFAVSALFLLFCLVTASRNYASADEYDRQCNEFLRAVVPQDVNFFAAPYYLSLDYVNEYYPVKWSFLPDNEKTLRLLAGRYPLGLLIVPLGHPLSYDEARGLVRNSLLDGAYTKTAAVVFRGQPFLIFSRSSGTS